ncbi:DUF2934 domain-containing protein [Myxococcus qinghaiensis]|uniref:DUF2934 domain-containing protein n=1 Tax=Myxococcus qinghaiensis TaxID=2906758 RepID=UPI0020A795EE|nr:DUF2934 domain-containing protein [Myxococcus qinghaiensis]MCP3167580.1 DUF2934 domain-containing protein [Myxococcus qinghaiensis]
MARNSTHKPTPQTATQPTEHAHESKASRGPIPHEQIARRAYEIYLARGGNHGSHEQDWQQAERELKLGRQ